MKTLHLLDYGVGNIGSLQAMFDALGYAAVLTESSRHVRESSLLVLPGVGSATSALRQLRTRHLLEPLADRHTAQRPIVGICLGAQLLFSHLAEAAAPGLNFLPGLVEELPPRIRFNTGWRRLDWQRRVPNGFGVGLKASDTFFFNHQYALPPDALSDCVTVASEPQVPAIVFGQHLCAIQFHPEKSQAPGRTFMRNVLRHYHGL